MVFIIKISWTFAEFQSQIQPEWIELLNMVISYSVPIRTQGGVREKAEYLLGEKKKESTGNKKKDTKTDLLRPETRWGVKKGRMER